MASGLQKGSEWAQTGCEVLAWLKASDPGVMQFVGVPVLVPVLEIGDSGPQSA